MIAKCLQWRRTCDNHNYSQRKKELNSLKIPNQDLFKDLTDFLASMKLSSYEIKTYMSGLHLGDSTARNIAKHSSVPPGRIYNVLKSLETLGLCEIHEGRRLHRNAASAEGYSCSAEEVCASDDNLLTSCSLSAG